MRVSILTTGTRGDLQPYLALGLGLRAAGHRVRLATHAEYEARVRGLGLDFAPIQGSPREVLKQAAERGLLEAGGGTLGLIRGFYPLLGPIFRRCLADCLRACEGSEVVLFSQAVCYGHWVAEKLGVRSAAAYYIPMTPTRWFPCFVAAPMPAWLPIGRGLYNRLTYDLGAPAVWALLAGVANEARREVLGLPPLPFHKPPWRSFPAGHPYLYAFSSAFLPRPPDWDGDKHVTGFWFLPPDPAWTPPAGLVEFLRDGPPPVYVGFGSMMGRDSRRLVGLVVEALGRAKQRGVFLGGAGGSAGEFRLPGHVFPVEAASFDWLFPRVAAVVHHGGSGTTALGLRAGRPTVTVPFMADQFLWSRRVFELGAGPRPIPRKRLTARRLAEAIRQAVADAEMCRRAQGVGRAIGAEHGVVRAVTLIGRYFGSGRPSHRRECFLPDSKAWRVAAPQSPARAARRPSVSA